jgi:hypothetical protein
MAKAPGASALYHAEGPAFANCDLRRQSLGGERARLAGRQRAHARRGNQCVGLVVVGLEPQPSRRAAEAFQGAVELGPAAQLGAAQPGAAQIDAGVDLDHGAAAIRQWIHREDWDLAVDPVE